MPIVLGYKRLTVFLTFILIFQYAYSVNNDKTNINKIVRGWLKTSPPYIHAEQQKNPFKMKDGVVEVQDEKGEEIVAYVVNLEPTGYVIIAPDDRMTPVIAYSTKSQYIHDETKENILLQLLRADIPERRRALRDGVVPQNRIDRARSKRLALEAAGEDEQRGLQKAGPVKLHYEVEFGPFLTSTWGQGTHNNDFVNGLAVWNYYTPPNAEGSPGNYVCGCVATAMAQVMNYYEWPPAGTNSYSYTWNNGSDPPEVLSADFSATAYDWANMLDGYQIGGTESQRQAAGLLTTHCGIAVDMNYTSSGSGAYSELIEPAMQKYFRHYAQYLDSTATFIDKLYSNMENSRPAVLSIQRDGGGHSVVVDGVRHDTGGDKYFHINLGWRGYGYPASNPDGWYNLEEPIVTTGNTYHLIPDATVNIIPTPVMDNLPETATSPDLTVSWVIADHLNASAYELQNAQLSSQLNSFSDGAENDMMYWDSVGHWEISSQYHSYPNSFYGYISHTGVDNRIYSILTLNKFIRVYSTSTIDYYWRTVHFDGTEARLEISTDGANWDALRTHTVNNQNWVSESVPAIDMSSYHDQDVLIRWVIEYYGGGYIGYGYGFYLDDFNINNAYISDWTTYDNTIISENDQIQFTESGDYAFRVRAEADGRWWNFSNFETVSVNALEVRARVLIEGAYEAEGDTLRLDLNAEGYLPSESPYTEAPVTCTTMPDSIADWILVELRASPAGPAVEQRSALLSKHGYICNMTGSQGVLFDAADGDYYIVIHQRNHLSIMSAEPQTMAR